MNARPDDLHRQADGLVRVTFTSSERRVGLVAVGVIVGLLATGVIAAIADHARLGVVATKLDTVIENQRDADHEREQIRERLRRMEISRGPAT